MELSRESPGETLGDEVFGEEMFGEIELVGEYPNPRAGLQGSMYRVAQNIMKCQMS